MARPVIKGISLALAAASLTACATQVPPVEVTRFHAGDPVARSGGFLVSAAPGTAEDSIEFRTYAAAVRQEMQRVGFVDETGLKTFKASDLVALVGYRRDVIDPTVRRSPVSVGVGGSTGSYGSGLGVGIGIDLSGKPKPVVATELTVQIRRRADGQAIWEGRATTQAKEGTPASQPGIAAEKLAAALFSNYPGRSGETITVR